MTDTKNTFLLCLAFGLAAACGGDDPEANEDTGADTPSADTDASADTPTGDEICFNAQDDDGDGDTDCDDADCASDPSCLGDEVCGNGEDDNGDGLTDCDDPQCADELACSCPGTSVDGIGFVEDETIEGTASEFQGSCGGDGAELSFSWIAPEAGTYTIDTLDASFDTVLYVLDGTCGGEELACNDDLYTSESCGVEGDEDGNGLADCEDPHCALSYLCVDDAPEDCDNDEDDDGDELVDCEDLDCGFDPSCLWSPTVFQSLVTLELEAGQEIIVFVDGYDDEEFGNLFLNFSNDRELAETVCDDDLDADLDGLYDCADPDCAGFDGCTVACELEDLGSALGEVATGDTTEAQRNFVGTCSSVGDPHLSGGRNAPDVAYLWTAPGTGEYTFDTESSDQFGEDALDSVLYVRAGDCDGVELACNDDIDGEAENYQSSVTVELEAGEAIVIIVDGWRFSDGQYALTIDGPEGEPEPVVEICDNEVDDDGDDAADCDDDDCAEAENCLD
ncbi:MAG: hypothetical protein ACJAYU_003720 [Bradymonadia bacterium]|jgi:hypothetical protein